MTRRRRKPALKRRPPSLALPGLPLYVRMEICKLHGRVIWPCQACRVQQAIRLGAVKPRADRQEPRLCADGSPNPRYRPERGCSLDLANGEQSNYERFWQDQPVLPPVEEPDHRPPALVVTADEEWFVEEE